MATVQPTTRPLFYAAWDGTNVKETGLTRIGELTISGMTLLNGEDENSYLLAVAGKAGNYKPLPGTGVRLEAGEIYGYGGGLVIVRQSHSRTSDVPADVPALFSVYRVGQTGDLAWVANERVETGQRRTHAGKTWSCVQGHTTQVDWQPGTVPSLWVEVVVVLPGAWAAGVAYKVGDVVSYQSKTYRCLQAHTSIVTWTPNVVPALWLLI